MTLKEIEKLEEKYLIDVEVRSKSKEDECIEFLLEMGEDPKDHNIKKLVKEGFCD